MFLFVVSCEEEILLSTRTGNFAQLAQVNIVWVAAALVAFATDCATTEAKVGAVECCCSTRFRASADGMSIWCLVSWIWFSTFHLGQFRE